MKPMLAGALCATAICIGWVADDAIKADPVQPSPTVVTTVPIQYVEVTTTTSSTTTSTTSTQPEPLVYVDTPCQEWIPLAVEVGWPRDRELLHRLGLIMWRESRCDPTAHNPRDPNGGSFGLTQINGFWTGWLKDNGLAIQTADSLYQPRINLEAALAIHVYSTYKNGNGWHPWRT